MNWPENLTKYRKDIKHWLEQGLELIYPTRCPLCGKFDCSCGKELIDRYREQQTCKRCGKFMPEAGVCPDCILREEGFPERVWALGPYTGELRAGLHRFKYKGEQRAGKVFADWLVECFKEELADVDLVVPVPLHREKLSQRGYNQAESLAQQLAASMGLKSNASVLQRVTLTKPQAGLSRKERLMNMADAFRVLDPKEVVNKRVLLVDDIITTGFTMEACGIALRKAGVKGLKGICVAAGQDKG